MYPGFESRESRVFFFLIFFNVFFCFFFVSIITVQISHSTLLSLPRFSYFITPYDAQASSAFSSLIKLLQDPRFPIISQWKLQVAIATKVLVGITK